LARLSQANCNRIAGRRPRGS